MCVRVYCGHLCWLVDLHQQVKLSVYDDNKKKEPEIIGSATVVLNESKGCHKDVPLLDATQQVHTALRDYLSFAFLLCNNTYQ